MVRVLLYPLHFYLINNPGELTSILVYLFNAN